MMFGEVRVDDAEGLILAHSLRLEGAMLKKGRVLDTADLRLLKSQGINFVTGARLEEGDIGENEAARLLAEALAGEGVTVGPALFGRCNLFAAARGLAVIDRDRLDRLNLVDEAVTVATVTPFDPVSRRQFVATIKIIPFGVDRRVVEACAAYASAGGPLVRVQAFVPRRTAVVLTTLPGVRDSVLDAFAEVTRARIEALGGTIVQEIRCPHEVGALERVLTKQAAGGCDQILVAGASATVDRRDTVPAAIERAGGAIDHFGMPVDPGNLLLLGHIGAVPVINLPGCSRSSKPNGLDWVLGRLAAGVAIKSHDIMRMGAGGLLKGLPARPLPGAHAAEPKVAAVVLAHVGARELLGDVRGKPRIGRVVEDALKAGLAPVVVVTAEDADMIEEMLPACDVLILRDQTTPVEAALAALPADVDAAILVPAHEPRVQAAHLAKMVRAYEPDEGRAVVVTVRRGRRGSPILVGRDHFDQLAEAADPTYSLADLAEAVFELATDEPTVL